MKKRTKRNTIIAFAIILILIIGFFGTLYYVTNTVNNFSYGEKKWINDNSKNTIDVYVQNSLPVFAYNGVGVYYDYINALKDNTGLNLNVVTTDSPSVKLVNKNVINQDDVLIFKDHFVILGDKDEINKLDDLNYKNVGVIKDDSETIKYYLTEHENISIKEFDDFTALKAAKDGKTINYMIVPLYKYINEIITNDIEIIYHLDGLYSYYCLCFDEANNNLKNIFTKLYFRYENAHAK